VENEVERETLKDRDSEGEKRSEVEVLREIGGKEVHCSERSL